MKMMNETKDTREYISNEFKRYKFLGKYKSNKSGFAGQQDFTFDYGEIACDMQDKENILYIAEPVESILEADIKDPHIAVWNLEPGVRTVYLTEPVKMTQTGNYFITGQIPFWPAIVRYEVTNTGEQVSYYSTKYTVPPLQTEGGKRSNKRKTRRNKKSRPNYSRKTRTTNSTKRK